MNSLQRVTNKKMNLLQTAIYRYNIGKNFMDEIDWQRMYEAIDGVDIDALLRVVDRNHAKALQANNTDFMSLVYKRQAEMRGGEIK